MDIDKKFIEEFEQAFYDRVDYIFWEVYNSNPKRYQSEEYKKYNKICNKIKESNPNVIRVLEDHEAVELSVSDVKALIRYIKNDHFRKITEDKELMFRTAQETILLLKKLNMLKSNEDN